MSLPTPVGTYRLWGALGNIIKETAGVLEASVMAHFGRNSRKRRDGKKKRKAKRRCQASGFFFFSFLQRWELTHWAANIAFQIPRPLATDQSSEPPSIDASLCADRWKSKATPGSGRNRRRRRLKNGWNFWISPQDYQFPIWGFIEWDAQIIRFGHWSGNKWWFKQGPPVCGIQYGWFISPRKFPSYLQHIPSMFPLKIWKLPFFLYIPTIYHHYILY